MGRLRRKSAGPMCHVPFMLRQLALHWAYFSAASGTPAVRVHRHAGSQNSNPGRSTQTIKLTNKPWHNQAQTSPSNVADQRGHFPEAKVALIFEEPACSMPYSLQYALKCQYPS